MAKSGLISSRILLLLLGVMAAPAGAQQVAEIQVLPPELTLLVDSSDLIIAQVFDERGSNIQDAQIRWLSSNVNVARVVPDPGQPTATVIGVGEGIAQIEARVGNVSSIVVVQVILALPEAQPVGPAAAIRLDSLPNAVDAASRRLIARVEPHHFGFLAPCRVGGFIGSDLLLTSYSAIRGADSIHVVMPSGARVTTGVMVAAYDPQADLAVLHLPVQSSGEIVIGGNPVAQDYVWAVGQPDCQATATTATRVASAAAPGLLSLEAELGDDGMLGAPLINRDGEIVGVAAGGSRAVRASNIRVLDVEARRNLALGSLQTPTEVAAAEQHAFGTVTLSSAVLGADAHITPLEDWQWPELEQRGPLPISFAGPTGRYEVQLLSSGTVQSTTTVTIQAGLATSLALTPAGVVAGQQPQPQTDPTQIGAQPSGGGGFPVAVVVIGLLAGGGGAAAFLLKPKENGVTPPPGGNGLPATTLGGIRFTIPVIP